MLPTISVANYFIGKALQEGDNTLTPMKLIKLVYIAHGWHLANYNNEPLIGEAVEAWKYGPVIPSLYHEFKQYRNSPITQQKVIFNEEGEAVILTAPAEYHPFLDAVWENYKNYSCLDLSTITHQNETPWHKTWVVNKGSQLSGAIISTESIAEHYRERVNAS